jgi:hypothetical protein
MDKAIIFNSILKALTENKIIKLVELFFIWIPETDEEKATAKKAFYEHILPALCKAADQYANGGIKF